MKRFIKSIILLLYIIILFLVFLGIAIPTFILAYIHDVLNTIMNFFNTKIQNMCTKIKDV